MKANEKPPVGPFLAKVKAKFVESGFEPGAIEALLPVLDKISPAVMTIFHRIVAEEALRVMNTDHRQLMAATVNKLESCYPDWQRRYRALVAIREVAASGLRHGKQ